MNSTRNRLLADRSVRVGLVEDQRLILECLRNTVDESGDSVSVLFAARSADEALAGLESSEIDVLVTDINMPGIDGIELVRRVKQLSPKTRTIVLTMYQDADLVERAVRAGAWGYLLKDSSPEDLVSAIRSVDRGERCFRTGLPAQTVAQYRFDAAGGAAHSTTLTARQLEVLKYICDGLTETEIADELGISHHTVHVHKNNVMQTLGVHSKIDLLKYAVRHKLVLV